MKKSPYTTVCICPLQYARWNIWGFLGVKMKIGQKILAVLASLGTVQSAALLFGNQNLGNFLIYGLTSGCWIYSIKYDVLNQFCSKGVWKWLRRMVLVGLTILSGLTVFVALSGRSSTMKGNEKAIIVLGAGLRGEYPSGMLARRLDAAYSAWQQNPSIKIVVSGGQGPDEVIPEAQAMANYLFDKGVPAENILQENKSTNTLENFKFSKEILEQNGITLSDPIVFATSDFHCWRGTWAAHEAGFTQVTHIPAPTPISRILPSWLREAAGVAYYTTVYHFNK